MSNKRITKSDFTIKKVRRVLKTSMGNFGTFDAYRVTGPNKTNKYFISRTHAVNWVKQVTDTTPIK